MKVSRTSSTSSDLKVETTVKTILYDTHNSLSARLIDFGGWQMPVMYSNIVEEHLNVRNKAGLFDLCHMGRLTISGPRHKDFLHRVLSNNVHDLQTGHARYSLICNEAGTVLDDILIYADDDNSTFMVVNAGNREKIVGHLKHEAKGSDTLIIDQSFEMGMIAIQGPNSVDICNEHCDKDLSELPYYGHVISQIFGVDCRIARTGYTGEDGFEFFMSIDKTVFIWNQFLKVGQAKGLLPIGLGARDTLRLEAGMPLYGHEIDEQTNPLEAGLTFAVKLKKEPVFIGQESLIKTKSTGVKKILVGLELKDKRVPRQGYIVKHGGNEVGVIVSGTASPSLKKNVGHAFVPPELKAAGTEISVVIRGKEFPALVTPKPFYKRNS